MLPSRSFCPYGHLKDYTIDEFAVNDHQDVIDDYYVCEFPNWVNVVAVTPQNEVLLVREYRYPIGEDAIAIPAGKVEEGEKESIAAARELKEETGFCTKDDFVLLGSFYTNAANATNKVFTFLKNRSWICYLKEYKL